MMRVIALVCEMAAPGVCTEIHHDFLLRQPIACIFAAGPELAPLIPDGWTVVRISCTTAPPPADR